MKIFLSTEFAPYFGKNEVKITNSYILDYLMVVNLLYGSYRHDSNVPLIEKIKEYLSKDAEGNLKHGIWIDTSEIKTGKDWRAKITKEVLESDVVLAGF